MSNDNLSQAERDQVTNAEPLHAENTATEESAQLFTQARATFSRAQSETTSTEDKVSDFSSFVTETSSTISANDADKFLPDEKIDDEKVGDTEFVPSGVAETPSRQTRTGFSAEVRCIPTLACMLPLC